MAQFRSFEDMDVWKDSRVLIREIRRICKRNTTKKDFPFVDQITRSARSIAANIAEGSEALTNPEFITYLGYAKKSAGETRSHLYDALDDGYITQEEFVSLAEGTRKISGMLAKLIHYLQTLDPKMKRTFKESYSTK
jgi:four helix bundle protein